MTVRSIGIERAAFNIGLTNLTSAAFTVKAAAVNPQTGGRSLLYIGMILLSLGGIGLTAVFVKRKKEKNNR